ncbi:MAG: CoA-binding protein [Candidatus Omnitrophica bacterium]|nr:CoA-binding protein [Candidatus Omnitrophota bacterium]
MWVYIGKAHSDKIIEDIVALKPERIIFNPGAENDVLEAAAGNAGIATIQACTLALLRTGQFAEKLPI